MPVRHRSLFNIGFGPDTQQSALAARHFELRDLLMYDNVTYRCGFAVHNGCARGVMRRNWRHLVSLDRR